MIEETDSLVTMLVVLMPLQVPSSSKEHSDSPVHPQFASHVSWIILVELYCVDPTAYGWIGLDLPLARFSRARVAISKASFRINGSDRRDIQTECIFLLIEHPPLIFQLTRYGRKLQSRRR